ncbi:MAG: FlgD immunoglobulin-like domain containing protein [Methanosarcinaceae archaeon]
MKISLKLVYVLLAFYFWGGDTFIFARSNLSIHSSKNKSQFVTKTSGNLIRINDDTGDADQGMPEIAMNKYGYTVICWMDYRAGSSVDIYAQLFDKTGFTIKKNFRVNDNPGTSGNNPDVAMDNLGNFVIVWEDYRNGESDIFSQRFQANGDPVGVNIKVNDDAPDNDNLYPKVAVDGDGNFVVVWEDQRASPRSIYAQRFNNAGARVGSNFKVNDIDGFSNGSPVIDMNESGIFVIAWTHWLASLKSQIYAQRFSGDGTFSGSNFAVSNYPDDLVMAYSPTIAVKENGDFIVGWTKEDYVTLDHTIFERIFNRQGTPISGQFELTDGNEGFPAAFVNPDGSYGVLWEDTREWGISAQIINANGGLIGSSFKIHDLYFPNSQPCIAIDNRTISVIAWQDNGADDGGLNIYATALGPLIPLNLVAGDGFDGIVPLSWDQIYATPGIIKYNIYRSAASGGPYTKVSSVNLSDRGVLGNLMRDWIDTDVTNGTSYYYVVTADISGRESSFSNEVSATPSSVGYDIRSGWTVSSPVIDGSISSGEWDNAVAVDITNPSAPQPITLRVMNDANNLYLAIDDLNDENINAGNMLGILFDEDHNRVWDVTGPSEEGLITINSTAASFVGYWGEYPNSLGADMPKSAPGVEKGISYASGNVQYEVRFDLTSSPLNAVPGETIGFAVWISDPGNFYPYHYGNSAEWPAGMLWECATPLGNLILAETTGIVDNQIGKNSPAHYYLSRNYPNPFNPQTTIEYHLPQTSEVVLTIHNTLGQKIRRLVHGIKAAGQYSVHWDGCDELDVPVASGIYFYQIQMGDYSAVRKMLLLE